MIFSYRAEHFVSLPHEHRAMAAAEAQALLNKALNACDIVYFNHNQNYITRIYDSNYTFRAYLFNIERVLACEHTPDRPIWKKFDDIKCARCGVNLNIEFKGC